MKKIVIKVDNYSLNAILHDTLAGNAIWESLPIQSKGNLWGEEIYFPIDAKAKMKNPKDVVEEGDLGFWPPGSAFCMFYGQTPMSSPGEIRPASAVEVVGKMTGDYRVLLKIKNAPTVIIDRATR